MAIVEIAGFEGSWNKAVYSVKRRTEKTLREAYGDLFTAIIQDTPVDTGRLKGNWQVGINTLPGGETNNLDPDGGETVHNCIEVLGGFKFGDYVFFVNNAPYAELIEYGRSDKAPYGMVRINIVNFDAICDSAARRNGG